MFPPNKSIFCFSQLLVLYQLLFITLFSLSAVPSPNLHPPPFSEHELAFVDFGNLALTLRLYFVSYPTFVFCTRLLFVHLCHCLAVFPVDLHLDNVVSKPSKIQVSFLS